MVNVKNVNGKWYHSLHFMFLDACQLSGINVHFKCFVESPKTILHFTDVKNIKRRPSEVGRI